VPTDLGGVPTGSAIRPMRVEDLEEILAIEVRSFPSPWQPAHFLHEITRNPVAVNRVVEVDGRIVAYACLWRVEEEIAINDFAVHPEARRRGFGSWFLGELLREAAEHGCTEATLEVRPSNVAARRLYERHGFRETGRRPKYYAREDEDAIVMGADLRLVGRIEPDGGRAV